MADSDHHQHHHHHHHHRPNRLSLPTRPFLTTSTHTPSPYFTPTPSKLNRSTNPSLTHRSPSSSKSSLSFLLLLLFSLRSLYSLLPFLRSSPSFSLFPFTFLVSLFSFLLSLSFSLFSTHSSSSSYRDPFKSGRFSQHQIPILSLYTISYNQHKVLLCKSIVLTVVFLLRFQALRYCGTAAMILAELSGNVVAKFEMKSSGAGLRGKVRGFVLMLVGLVLLSVSWDRVECFPFSGVRGLIPGKECVRVWLMVLPFMSGFLGSYERRMMNWGTIRQLGQKRVRLVCLLYATVILFVPAVVGYFVFESLEEKIVVTIGRLVWPLVNMVVFGLLLSENYSDEKVGRSGNLRREFLVTFACLVVLELFYFPNLSLWGLVVCGILIWMAVGELSENDSGYVEIGVESSDSFVSSTMKAVRHILSERKSRKIALFLLINTSYMVVEFIVGFMCNSLGLISDACHMLFDCAALAIGLYASYISRLPANHQFNYGRGRFEVLSGYTNAVFLVLVGALIVLESIERILDPQEISTNSLLTVSIGGLVVNMIGLVFFHDEHHHAHGGSAPCSHSHHSHAETDHQKSYQPLMESHSSSTHGHDHGHAHPIKGHECNHIAPCSNDHGKQASRSPAAPIQQHSHCNHDHQHNHSNHDHQHNHGKHESCKGSSPDLPTVEVHSHKHLIDDNPCWELSGNHHHHHVDHNMEGIFLHVLADTMGSVGVVLSTLLIKYKGWLIADPASSIFISVLIVSSVIPLLRNSAEILLQRVPRAREADLKAAIENIKEVHGVQNMHIWSFTTSEVVGTLHLHVSTEADKVSAKAQVSKLLHDAGVKDLTIQVECLRNT